MERAALAALCASRGWICSEQNEVRGSLRAMERVAPSVILTRHRLSDGFSDDLMRQARRTGTRRPARILVFAPATLPAQAEARQISLGADAVLRDPIRSEVLCAYLERFLGLAELSGTQSRAGCRRRLPIARASLDPNERLLRFRGRSIRLTPRESSLCEALVRNRGQLAPYETLFLEVLDRKFTGDTSNLRVLLGKLAHSFARLGIDLRRWVDVIPKAGHKLLAHPHPTGRPPAPRRQRSSR